MKHFIIPIFIPHFGCTHQCVFCNQKKITGSSAIRLSGKDVANLIELYLARLDRPRRVEVAFYGGSFTALSVNYQRELLTPAALAQREGRIHAIRLSTRPDAISSDILQHLLSYGVSIVELGAQSLDDGILATAARGHTVNDIERAVCLLREAGLSCGLQLMLGLPGETWELLPLVAARLLRLKPDMLRIYPTLVIAGTPLADLYQNGHYAPLTVDEAVRRAAFFRLLCDQQGISVIRTGLQATEELDQPSVVLAGPYHPSFGEMVEARLFSLMFQRFAAGKDLTGRQLAILHHPRDHSKLRGLSNANLRNWQEQYGFNKLSLYPAGSKAGELIIEYEGLSHVVNKQMLCQL
ncbi:elongator complex protein 3 [Propionispora hippei]|uniref:Radical SAM superfamily protein n=1 Tax=Propionispora hippei DSM 15287 TaxID=1123003 RepID=A0A1M6CVK8_9FIRM|nr:radical SAM protein [Propionispora hippei]SHI64768.1 Radical SAM superfamily protein [Propionispora hippei DSM 15287]